MFWRVADWSEYFVPQGRLMAGDLIAEAAFFCTAESAPESSTTSRHPTMGRFQQGVEQEEVTTAIAAGQSAAHGDDAVAAEATVRLARRAGPDAVKFLRRVVVTEGWSSVPQRVRASCALLEVGGHLVGSLSSETRSNAAFRGQEGADGGADAGETS
jgi:hypothetical protein